MPPFWSIDLFLIAAPLAVKCQIPILAKLILIIIIIKFQTNKEDTFRAIQSADRPNEVGIFLAKPLQYERVRVYTLTLQVRMMMKNYR